MEEKNWYAEYMNIKANFEALIKEAAVTEKELQTVTTSYWNLNNRYCELLKNSDTELVIVQKNRDYYEAMVHELRRDLQGTRDEVEKYKMLWKRECEAFRTLAIKYDDWLDAPRRDKNAE